MHDLYYDLVELCETVGDEIHKSNEKIKKAGGQVSPSDIEYLDKLTHMIKSIKTTKAMMDAEDGYSSDDMGSSYARGRVARRDSRGRYSRDGWPGMSHSRDGMMRYDGYYEGRSYDGDMVTELKELMEKAPNNHIRQKFEQFITEVERMK